MIWVTDNRKKKKKKKDKGTHLSLPSLGDGSFRKEKQQLLKPHLLLDIPAVLKKLESCPSPRQPRETTLTGTHRCSVSGPQDPSPAPLQSRVLNQSEAFKSTLYTQLRG